jgi:hypothetical protein
MFDPRPTPTEAPPPRIGGSERRANFVAHMGVVAGDEGTAALAEEGVDAHRVSTELQGVARGNTPGDSRRFAHVRGRRTAVTIGLLALFVCGFAWMTDNVVGYSQRGQSPTIVRVADTGATATVVLSDGQRVSVECFDAKPGLAVWKAAAPAGSLVGYRCGNDPIDAEFPGVLSVTAGGVLVLSAGTLLFLRARWRRKNAWY